MPVRPTNPNGSDARAGSMARPAGPETARRPAWR
ncbi:CSD domain-containing protein [Psidium guajava]|nr:CSD domain-containing protein [Psidium guajava]